jgi:hypothetical protein
MEMSVQSEYESQAACLIEQCDAGIAAFCTCADEESPDVSAGCREEISVLIANRESLKRGLIRPDKSGSLCSSCPDEVAEGT